MIDYKNISLAKILNIVFVVMLIPFLVLSIWLHNNNREEVRESINITMRRLADNVAFLYIKPHIDRINDSFNLLKNDKSTDTTLIDLSNEENGFISSAIMVFNRSMYFSSLILSNNNQEYIILPEIKHTVYKVEDRPWFPHYGRDGEVVYSSAYISAYSEARGENKMGVTAAMNVYNNNKRRIGTVAFDLDMNYLSENLKYLTLPYNSHLTVTDKNGIYIINDNLNKNLNTQVPTEWIARAEHKQSYFYDEKTRTHVYYYVYPNPEWFIFATISDVEFNKMIGRSNKDFLVALSTCTAYYIFFAILCHSVCSNVLVKINMRLNGQDLKKYDVNKGVFALMKKIDRNNKDLHETKRLATTDPLTGLPNRRKLEEQFEENVNNQTPMHLAIIDVDNFKQVNDRYGHVCGDDVLTYLGSSGQELCDENTRVYRYGGEEFVVLFTHQSMEESMAVMNRWLQRVAHRRWREEDLTITFSGGLVARTQESLSVLLGKADEALYQAKKTGKNRIVQYQSS